MPLSCFFHFIDGSRCNRFTDPEKYLCWRHVEDIKKLSNRELLAEAAKLFCNNIHISKNGQLNLICKDYESWLYFCNYFQGLLIKGYDESEIIEYLSNILSFSAEFIALLKKVGSFKKWKGFEALVARILLSIFRNEMDASTFAVMWNVNLPSKLTNRKRQIDVLIQRIKEGNIQSIEIIQCKDYEESVAIKEVDAIHSVMQEVGANKATIVSPKGFQKGAIEKARALQIDLITLQKSISDWATKEKSENKELPQIDMIQLVPAEKTDSQIYGECDPFGIYFDNVGTHERSFLRDYWTIVQNHIKENKTKLPDSFEIKVPLNSIAFHGKGNLIGQVSSIVFKVSTIENQENKIIDIPPSAIEYVLKNIVSSANNVVRQSDMIPTIHIPKPEKTRFYINSKGQAYKCIETDDALTKMLLVEDVQHGQKISVIFTYETNKGVYYFEINDRTAIKRLKQDSDKIPLESKIT